MKTTVIPAQITTVEDKIAGNLNFTQILLMLSALMIDTAIYAALPLRLHFSLYKIPLMVIATLICMILSLRIKNRVVLNWIFLLSSYYFRPRYYLFNKNDLFLREQIIFTFDTKKPTSAKAFQTKKSSRKSLTFGDFIKVQLALATHPKLDIKFRKKGEADVSFSEIKS